MINLLKSSAPSKTLPATAGFAVRSKIRNRLPTIPTDCACLQFAVVHDLAESVTGDYTPGDHIEPRQKYALELKAMQDIAAKSNCPRLVDLFVEYERRDTPEAVFVKKMDKLDVVLQARYYDMHDRSRYFDRKREWTSLFEEYEKNARPILGALWENCDFSQK